MEIQSVSWVGTRTDRFAESVAFFGELLGLEQVVDRPDFAEFKTSNGDTIEVFGPSDEDHRHFDTGPVVGFQVDDVHAVRRRLEDAGIEFFGPVGEGAGMAWAHFRGADGNVYELMQVTGK